MQSQPRISRVIVISSRTHQPQNAWKTPGACNWINHKHVARAAVYIRDPQRRAFPKRPVQFRAFDNVASAGIRCTPDTRCDRTASVLNVGVLKRNLRAEDLT